MSQPTTTPTPALRIHQPPDGQTPSAPVTVPAPVTTPAEIAAAIGAKASRYATTPIPCKGCGRPTLGSFGPQGLDGAYWFNVCQSCKDAADAELESRARHTTGVVGRVMAAFRGDAGMSRDRQPESLPLVSVGPSGIGGEYQTEIQDESGSAGVGSVPTGDRYVAQRGCGRWVVLDTRQGPRDDWYAAVGLSEDEARTQARVMNERGMETRNAAKGGA